MTPDQYRREGAEAMRERAANVCDDYPRILPSYTEWNLYDEQIDHSVRNIRAIDVDEVLAGLPPVAVIGGHSVVKVCPICDIAGCRHIREAEKAPDAVARLVEAAQRLAIHIEVMQSIGEAWSVQTEAKVAAILAAMKGVRP